MIRSLLIVKDLKSNMSYVQSLCLLNITIREWLHMQQCRVLGWELHMQGADNLN